MQKCVGKKPPHPRHNPNPIQNMNLKEYQKRALETAKFPREQALTYCTLGLCGEIAELLEVCISHRAPDIENEKAELGGCAWYCAVLAHFAGMELKENASDYPLPDWPESYASGMAMHAGLIANKVKKVMRDGTPVDPVFLATNLGAVIRFLHEYSVAIDRAGGLSDVLEKNVAKLADRAARGVIGGSGDNR
jgi:NTP pyrophosphatase (non-canonical NTP hydrolase)